MMDYTCFKWPFQCLISGPTKAGKTLLTSQIILSGLVDEAEVIYFHYAVYQPAYDQLVGRVVFCQGPPDMASLKEDKRRKLLILDDLMTVLNMDDLIQLYTVASHHFNLSIIHIVHNVFQKNLRTVRINCSHIILMRQPGDMLSVMNLARQMFPQNGRFMLDAFRDATKIKYGYLLIDFDPTTDERLRLRSQIFDRAPVVYIDAKRSVI